MQNCESCGGKRWLVKRDKNGLQVTHVITKDDGTKYTVRVWTCWRCGWAQEEEIPFTPIPFRLRAGILYIDLEVSKSLVSTYGLRVPSKYISPENLEREYFIICWSASYVGSKTVWAECVNTEEVLGWRNENRSPDARILARLQELMASADIIAGHNVDRYDMRRANTRFLLNGLEPVIDKRTLDTLKIARSKFAFESNGLDYISQRLGFRGKDDITNADWNRIIATGDEATLKRVLKYNKGDVTNGKSVLERTMRYSGKRAAYGSQTLDVLPRWLGA